MRFSEAVRLALLAGLLAAAACQPMPRPFAHGGEKDHASVAPLADSGGVVVLDVDGVPPAFSAALTRAMVEALAEQNIPAATSGSNVRSRFLASTATLTGDPAGRGPMDVAISWALTGRAGETLGTRAARMTVPRPVWIAPTHKALAPLAEDPARAVAALMQDPAPAEAEEKGKSAPLHVWPVAGAPGDGGLVLRRAMEAALDRRGFAVSQTLPEDGLVIAGSVALGEETGGNRPMEVEWAVLDRNGKELGKLAQKNTVPAGALESGWGGLAEIIAESAAGGVGALLAHLSTPGEETPDGP